MRHGRLRRKLGVKSNHRKALLRNLVRHLVIYKRIQTTWAKAKEASAFADGMVELAKKGADLHARRTLISKIRCPKTAGMLITQIAPHFKERKGGYTRVLRLGNRVGDGADMALLEFTAAIEAPKKPKKEKAKKAAQDAPARKEAAPEPKTTKKKDSHEGKISESRKEEKKASSEEKKESEKKGGFLGALRRFLKGDDER